MGVEDNQSTLLVHSSPHDRMKINLALDHRTTEYGAPMRLLEKLLTSQMGKLGRNITDRMSPNSFSEAIDVTYNTYFHINTSYYVI